VRLAASLDARGLPTAVVAKVVSPTIIMPVAPFLVETIRKSGVDPSAMEGMTEWPYAIEHRKVHFHLLDVPVPTSVMRTTGYGPNVFALESFIDELAHETRHDPLDYRRRLLHGNQRALHLLDRVARLSRWGQALAKGEGRGLAFSHAFGTLIAQVVRVRVKGPDVKVLEVVSVVDPGRVLDPVIAAAAIEGGAVFGMAGCKSEVSFSGGTVEQHNFDGYAMPYLSETPRFITEFVQSGQPLGGIGEVGPVTFPPALGNAVFAASGRRLRSMPLSRHGLQFA
jgi:isoquinoline 1-oxidoreductase beta subunit